jgi:hypothetical protein
LPSNASYVFNDIVDTIYPPGLCLVAARRPRISERTHESAET